MSTNMGNGWALNVVDDVSPGTRILTKLKDLSYKSRLKLISYFNYFYSNYNNYESLRLSCCILTSTLF